MRRGAGGGSTCSGCLLEKNEITACSGSTTSSSTTTATGAIGQQQFGARHHDQLEILVSFRASRGYLPLQMPRLLLLKLPPMDPLLVPRHYNRLTAGALCYYPVPCNERRLRANANGVPFRGIIRSHARAGIRGWLLLLLLLERCAPGL